MRSIIDILVCKTRENDGVFLTWGGTPWFECDMYREPGNGYDRLNEESDETSLMVPITKPRFTKRDISEGT